MTASDSEYFFVNYRETKNPFLKDYSHCVSFRFIESKECKVSKALENERLNDVVKECQKIQEHPNHKENLLLKTTERQSRCLIFNKLYYCNSV